VGINSCRTRRNSHVRAQFPPNGEECSHHPAGVQKAFLESVFLFIKQLTQAQERVLLRKSSAVNRGLQGLVSTWRH
jgi:hypothetical protein